MLVDKFAALIKSLVGREKVLLNTVMANSDDIYLADKRASFHH